MTVPAFGLLHALGGALLEAVDVEDGFVDDILVDLWHDAQLEGTLVLVQAFAPADPALWILAHALTHHGRPQHQHRGQPGVPHGSVIVEEA